MADRANAAFGLTKYGCASVMQSLATTYILGAATFGILVATDLKYEQMAIRGTFGAIGIVGSYFFARGIIKSNKDLETKELDEILRSGAAPEMNSRIPRLLSCSLTLVAGYEALTKNPNFQLFQNYLRDYDDFSLLTKLSRGSICAGFAAFTSSIYFIDQIMQPPKKDNSLAKIRAGLAKQVKIKN